jgi:hypothetical protein
MQIGSRPDIFTPCLYTVKRGREGRDAKTPHLPGILGNFLRQAFFGEFPKTAGSFGVLAVNQWLYPMPKVSVSVALSQSLTS